MTKRESLQSLKLCSLSSTSESFRNSPALQGAWVGRKQALWGTFSSSSPSSFSFVFGVILISFLTNLSYTTPKPPKHWSLSLFQFLVLYLSLKRPFMFILTCYYSIKHWEGERGGGDFP